jgi:hypothetical protein
MINADRELYDHITTKNETEWFDPDERCFPNGPFHDIEALNLSVDGVQIGAQAPSYRCRTCGHVWCAEPRHLKKFAQKINH